MLKFIKKIWWKIKYKLGYLKYKIFRKSVSVKNLRHEGDPLLMMGGDYDGDPIFSKKPKEYKGKIFVAYIGDAADPSMMITKKHIEDMVAEYNNGGDKNESN